jgi:penicillin-binding protein 2
MERKNHISYRIFILTGIFFLICLLYVVRLAGIVLTEEAPEMQDHTYQYVTIKAARGQIYDRNGVPLVTNQYVQNLVIDDQNLPDANAARNKELLTLISVFNNTEEAYKRVKDSYPFAGTYPNLTYLPEIYEDTTLRYRLVRRIAANEIEDGVKTHTVTALEAYYAENPDAFPAEQEIIDFFLKKYGMHEDNRDKIAYTDAQIDALLRLYYDMECNNFGGLNQYIFAADLSLATITKIEERGIAGVAFSYTVQRKYEYPGYASHILGTIGQIYAEDWEYYKELGYNMNDYVGISGCEAAFEQYLRGVDGVKVLEFDAKGNLIDEYYKKTPIAGNDVYLTIDIKLQIAAEDGLAENIKYIRDRGYNKDCESGSLVAMHPATGEVLAIASYPTFDLTTYNKDYSDLYADPAQPLYNRALQGLYAPGSAFKLGMVVAGMQEGIVDANTTLFCDKKYTYYSGYQPECTGRHGYINAANAICVSCNCYFYDLGRQLGITRMNQYCDFYGLGQKTGIELYEEVGILAGEAYREQNGLTTWQPGDTIAAAIGQSDNTFTPIQIASYVCTLLNGGTRYSAHLLHSVNTYFTGETVNLVAPKVLSEMNISQNTLDTVKYGMKLMVEDSATVSNFMRNVPVTVGGKTGTAQIGGKQIDNALFVCAAPYNDPDIVISVVIDKGAGGSYSSLSAARVLEAYYGE